jgi:hypothetical protein
MTSTTNAQSGSSQTSARPLDGLRVVDLTVINGELCPRLLCDLGAEVIKVEPPEGSAARSWAPVRKGVSLSFAVNNAGKLGVALDLTNPDDLAKYGFDPMVKRILKSDIPMYIDADPDIIKLSLKIGLQSEKIELLESIIKSITNRGYAIKTAVDFLRWSSGG